MATARVPLTGVTIQQAAAGHTTLMMHAPRDLQVLTEVTDHSAPTAVTEMAQETGLGTGGPVTNQPSHVRPPAHARVSSVMA